MKHVRFPELPDVQDYSALRQSGTQADMAGVRLGLGRDAARRMERVFQARATRGVGDVQLPKFARHDRHVAAVLAAGGFVAFSERRIGRDGVVICLPLIGPS